MWCVYVLLLCGLYSAVVQGEDEFPGGSVGLA